MKEKLKTLIEFLINPHFLLCFGIAWIITNGWAYIMFGFGTYFNVSWMLAISGAYLAFLWIPGTPEKIITVLIAMFLLKWLFPKDEKTLGILKSIHEKHKNNKKVK